MIISLKSSCIIIDPVFEYYLIDNFQKMVIVIDYLKRVKGANHFSMFQKKLTFNTTGIIN